MKVFLLLLILQCFVNQALSSINSTIGAINYLSKFGYIDRESELQTRSGNMNLQKFLLKFQEFFKLQRTGKLDKETLDIMNAPRCGVPDLFDNKQTTVDEKKRYKRYAVQGSSWKKHQLTWTISKFSQRPNLRNKHKQIVRVLDKAFSYWSANSKLKFTYVNNANRADIDIRFERLDHRDGSPFDGENNTLAHAYFRNYGGDVHFDDDEDWTVNDDQPGIHLLSVAIHELGHSLGLSHSSVENSVMYPTYDGIRTWLGKDDIAGIQSLYGAPSDKQASKPKKEENDDDICDSFDIDSSMCYKPHYCIAFKGGLVYKFKTDGSGGIANNYPKKISEIFLGMSGPIDAAFKDENKMFLIKKDIVYEFEKFFTHPIRTFNFRKLIPGWPSNQKQIDGIYKKRRTGNIYIFLGDLYWRFHRDKRMSHNYPKPISFFDNLPSGIDAVMDWDDDVTFFFKGNEYWAYDEKLNKMRNSDSENVLTEFLRCKE